MKDHQKENRLIIAYRPWCKVWKGYYGIDTDLLSLGSVPSLSVSTLAALSCTLGAEKIEESGCQSVWVLLFMVSSQWTNTSKEVLGLGLSWEKALVDFAFYWWVWLQSSIVPEHIEFLYNTGTSVQMLLITSKMWISHLSYFKESAFLWTIAPDIKGKWGDMNGTTDCW